MQTIKYPPPTLAWSMWALAATLYLIGFYHRVAPAVMTEELSTDFNLDATALGSLSAFYFYSYVAMQIPTGLLADRLGPRKLLSIGALLTGLGSFMFSAAQSVYWADLGRLLIGGGVSVAFVCMLKLADHWLVPKHFALATGLALFAGIIGATFAGVPLRLAINAFGWRDVMLVSAFIPLLVGVAIWLLVRDDPSQRGYQSYGHSFDPGVKRESVLTGLQQVLRYRNTWILTLLPGSIVGSVLAFAGLWGVPFLSTHYGLSITEAAAMNSSMLIAWAVAAPLFGAWSDRIGKRKHVYILGVGSLIILWSILIFIPDLSTPMLLLVMLCIGFASGCMIIGFAFAKESVPRQYSGTVSGIINMGVMIGPMILQPVIGYVLDHYDHSGTINSQDGMIYSLFAYTAGFSLMLLWLVTGFILLLFSRETFCRQQTF